MTAIVAKATIELNRIISGAEASEARKSKRDAALAEQALKIAKLQKRIKAKKSHVAKQVREAIDLDESAKLKALSASAIILVEVLHGYPDARFATAVDKLLVSVDSEAARALAKILPEGRLTIASLHALVEACGAAFAKPSPSSPDGAPNEMPSSEPRSD